MRNPAYPAERPTTQQRGNSMRRSVAAAPNPGLSGYNEACSPGQCRETSRRLPIPRAVTRVMHQIKGCRGKTARHAMADPAKPPDNPRFYALEWNHCTSSGAVWRKRTLKFKSASARIVQRMHSTCLLDSLQTSPDSHSSAIFCSRRPA